MYWTPLIVTLLSWSMHEGNTALGLQWRREVPARRGQQSGAQQSPISKNIFLEYPLRCNYVLPEFLIIKAKWFLTCSGFAPEWLCWGCWCMPCRAWARRGCWGAGRGAGAGCSSCTPQNSPWSVRRLLHTELMLPKQEQIRGSTGKWNIFITFFKGRFSFTFHFLLRFLFIFVL